VRDPRSGARAARGALKTLEPRAVALDDQAVKALADLDVGEAGLPERDAARVAGEPESEGIGLDQVGEQALEFGTRDGIAAAVDERADPAASRAPLDPQALDFPTIPAGSGRLFDAHPVVCDRLPPDRAKVRKHMQNIALFLDAKEKLKHSPPVDSEFNTLEAKVAQFVSLCERLREENVVLRQQLASAENDSKRLNEKIDTAKAKLAQLLSRLPG